MATVNCPNCGVRLHELPQPTFAIPARRGERGHMGYSIDMPASRCAGCKKWWRVKGMLEWDEADGPDA